MNVCENFNIGCGLGNFEDVEKLFVMKVVGKLIIRDVFRVKRGGYVKLSGCERSRDIWELLWDLKYKIINLVKVLNVLLCGGIVLNLFE